MNDLTEIYKDNDIQLTEKKIELQDSMDEYRTIIMKIGKNEFGFELAFGKLIHTWEKR